MRHDVRAFNSFIVLFLSPAQSLYLLGCLSSFAEPPLVGLTFGLRSGLAPLLRSRRSDVRRLAPSVTFTILGHSYRAYADLTRAILLMVSVAP